MSDENNIEDLIKNLPSKPKASFGPTLRSIVYFLIPLTIMMAAIVYSTVVIKEVKEENLVLKANNFDFQEYENKITELETELDQEKKRLTSCVENQKKCQDQIEKLEKELNDPNDDKELYDQIESLEEKNDSLKKIIFGLINEPKPNSIQWVVTVNFGSDIDNIVQWIDVFKGEYNSAEKYCKGDDLFVVMKFNYKFLAEQAKSKLEDQYGQFNYILRDLNKWCKARVDPNRGGCIFCD